MATQQQDRTTPPDHVPPALVWDCDYDAFAAQQPDPFRHVGSLHSGPDILWVSGLNNGPQGRRAGWLPVRHKLIREVLTDTHNFTSGGLDGESMMSVIGADWKLIPLELNPPQQQQYRKVLEPFFSPASINALDDSVRRACDELIDGFAGRDGCEFSGDFAEMFPSHIFLDLMGMPREKLADFLKWERGMLRPQSPEDAVTSMSAIADYLQEFIAGQKANPTSDLMRGIVNAQFQGDGEGDNEGTRNLTDTEMLSICYILYIGGLDTVYSTLGWIMWHLAQDRVLQDRLRDNPEETARAVEELLRAFSTASTQRRVARDLTFHGVDMRAGDIVQISLPLAARDPQVYEDPHRVDIDRPVRHIAFGTGPHTCLGLRLAKREIRIVLEAFLARFRNIRIPDGESHEFHTGNVFGIDRLALAWDRIEARQEQR